MLENREIDYSENISCPYCEKVLVDKEEGVEFETCEHTIFVATDYGFEYIREDVKKIIREETKPDGISIDEYTAGLNIEGIRIADYVPTPSFFGAYFGFKKEN